VTERVSDFRNSRERSSVFFFPFSDRTYRTLHSFVHSVMQSARRSAPGLNLRRRISEGLPSASARQPFTLLLAPLQHPYAIQCPQTAPSEQSLFSLESPSLVPTFFAALISPIASHLSSSASSMTAPPEAFSYPPAPSSSVTEASTVIQAGETKGDKVPTSKAPFLLRFRSSTGFIALCVAFGSASSVSLSLFEGSRANFCFSFPLIFRFPLPVRRSSVLPLLPFRPRRPVDELQQSSSTFPPTPSSFPSSPSDSPRSATRRIRSAV
jgi:hypothetical protein